MIKQIRTPVSTRALIQRVNRKLKPRKWQLKQTRPGTVAEQQLGKFYVLDLSRGEIASKAVDPEALGRKLEVLADWEHLHAE